MNVDMKGLKALQLAAAATIAPWHDAAGYVFKSHAGYVPALRAIQTAKDAYQAVFDKATAIVNQLASDPATDPSWFDAGNPDGAVWLRNNAQANLVAIDASRKDVLRDLASHFQLSPAVLSSPSPYRAAAAADAAAKSQLGSNPNTRDGSKQSNELPPAPTTGEEDYATAKKVGVFAAAGLALLWIVRRVM